MKSARERAAEGKLEGLPLVEQKDTETPAGDARPAETEGKKERSTSDVAGERPASGRDPPVSTTATSSTVDDKRKPVQVQGAPTCPICLTFFCEPVRTHCNHIYCRVCLLQTTHLSPDGRACPLCRAPLQMENPSTHPVDRALEQTVRSLVPTSKYEVRIMQGIKIMEELQERARSTLPIFYMSPGCRVGQPIALHMFEPRYRILIRRAMEGNNLFVYAARTPRFGNRACLVKVTSAFFHRDGRANIEGVGVEEFEMGNVWIEEGTAGLYYTHFVARRGGFNPASASATSSTVAIQEQANPRRGRERSRSRSSRSLSCAMQ